LCESVTGFADFANEIPNTLETKFASASAGKVFVAVGILQLNIYCADTNDFRTNIFSADAKGTGAFITVKDIVKFWNGLLENKLISEELVAKMFSKQSGDGIDAEAFAKEFYTLYWQEVLKTAQAGDFDVLGHIDFPKRYYSQIYYEEAVINEIFQNLMERDLVIKLMVEIEMRQTFLEKKL